jgi:hypothetical protein
LNFQSTSAGPVECDLQRMIGIRRDHEGPRLARPKGIFPHEPRHPFVV